MGLNEEVAAAKARREAEQANRDAAMQGNVDQIAGGVGGLVGRAGAAAGAGLKAGVRGLVRGIGGARAPAAYVTRKMSEAGVKTGERVAEGLGRRGWNPTLSAALGETAAAPFAVAGQVGGMAIDPATYALGPAFIGGAKMVGRVAGRPLMNVAGKVASKVAPETSAAVGRFLTRERYMTGLRASTPAEARAQILKARAAKAAEVAPVPAAPVKPVKPASALGVAWRATAPGRHPIKTAGAVSRFVTGQSEKSLQDIVRRATNPVAALWKPGKRRPPPAVPPSVPPEVWDMVKEKPTVELPADIEQAYIKAHGNKPGGVSAALAEAPTPTVAPVAKPVAAPKVKAPPKKAAISAALEEPAPPTAAEVAPPAAAPSDFAAKVKAMRAEKAAASTGKAAKLKEAIMAKVKGKKVVQHEGYTPTVPEVLGAEWDVAPAGVDPKVWETMPAFGKVAHKYVWGTATSPAKAPIKVRVKDNFGSTSRTLGFADEAALNNAMAWSKALEKKYPNSWSKTWQVLGEKPAEAAPAPVAPVAEPAAVAAPKPAKAVKAAPPAEVSAPSEESMATEEYTAGPKPPPLVNKNGVNMEEVVGYNEGHLTDLDVNDVVPLDQATVMKATVIDAEGQLGVVSVNTSQIKSPEQFKAMLEKKGNVVNSILPLKPEVDNTTPWKAPDLEPLAEEAVLEPLPISWLVEGVDAAGKVTRERITVRGAGSQLESKALIERKVKSEHPEWVKINSYTPKYKKVGPKGAAPGAKAPVEPAVAPEHLPFEANSAKPLQYVGAPPVAKKVALPTKKAVKANLTAALSEHPSSELSGAGPQGEIPFQPNETLPAPKPLPNKAQVEMMQKGIAQSTEKPTVSAALEEPKPAAPVPPEAPPTPAPFKLEPKDWFVSGWNSSGQKVAATVKATTSKEAVALAKKSSVGVVTVEKTYPLLEGGKPVSPPANFLGGTEEAVGGAGKPPAKPPAVVSAPPPPPVPEVPGMLGPMSKEAMQNKVDILNLAESQKAELPTAAIEATGTAEAGHLPPKDLIQRAIKASKGVMDEKDLAALEDLAQHPERIRETMAGAVGQPHMLAKAAGLEPVVDSLFHGRMDAIAKATEFKNAVSDIFKRHGISDGTPAADLLFDIRDGVATPEMIAAAEAAGVDTKAAMTAAKELQPVMDALADMASLQPGGRIRDYITHIVSNVKSERLSASWLALSRWAGSQSPFLHKPRLGTESFLRDPQKVIDLYIDSVTREIYLDRPLRAISALMSEVPMPVGTRTWVKNLFYDVAGMPRDFEVRTGSSLQTIAGQAGKAVNLMPEGPLRDRMAAALTEYAALPAEMAFNGALAGFKKFLAMKYLALRFSTSFNILQDLAPAFGKLGPERTISAFAKARSAIAGDARVSRLARIALAAVEEDMDPVVREIWLQSGLQPVGGVRYTAGEGLGAKTGPIMDGLMSTVTGPDIITKLVTFFGGHDMWLETHPGDLRGALRAGRELARESQALYLRETSPEVLRTGKGRLLTQFAQPVFKTLSTQGRLLRGVMAGEPGAVKEAALYNAAIAAFMGVGAATGTGAYKVARNFYPVYYRKENKPMPYLGKWRAGSFNISPTPVGQVGLGFMQLGAGGDMGPRIVGGALRAINPLEQSAATGVLSASGLIKPQSLPGRMLGVRPAKKGLGRLRQALQF